MNETLLGILLGSTLLVALINLIRDIFLWKANRKATLTDRQIDKDDEIKNMKKTISDHTDLLERILTSINDFETFYKAEKSKQDTINKTIITDRLRIKCGQLLNKEKITFNERKELLEMWNIYHNELGGNGNFDDIMQDIMSMEVDIEN